MSDARSRVTYTRNGRAVPIEQRFRVDPHKWPATAVDPQEGVDWRSEEARGGWEERQHWRKVREAQDTLRAYGQEKQQPFRYEAPHTSLHLPSTAPGVEPRRGRTPSRRRSFDSRAASPYPYSDSSASSFFDPRDRSPYAPGSRRDSHHDLSDHKEDEPLVEYFTPTAQQQEETAQRQREAVERHRRALFEAQRPYIPQDDPWAWRAHRPRPHSRGIPVSHTSSDLVDGVLPARGRHHAASDSGSDEESSTPPSPPPVQRRQHPYGKPWRRRHTLLALVPLLLVAFFYSSSSSSRIPFHHPLSAPIGNTTFSPTHDRQVPPYLHYVYGLSPTFGGKPFNFIHYVCLSSALHTLKPEVLFMHYVYEPDTWYWRRFVADVEATRGATRLEMVKERDVTEVHGNPVEHFAHKADVLRLEALRDYGGVYLDVDVLVVRDMAPLYRHEAVMGMESQPNLDPLLPPSGLCNAVIVAKPYSSFIVRWIDSYRTFNKSSWAKHSVTTPWDLAQAYPTEVTVLNKFAFFWPIWHDDHLRVVHRDISYSFHRADPLSPSRDTQFTYHLWESVAYERYLSPYDPDSIHQRGRWHGPEEENADSWRNENAFGREARRFVSEEMRRAWRKAREEGLVER
ncbi:hypothetical protein JCM10207_002813 [Rhodosporidiobolus poonsookiae]